MKLTRRHFFKGLTAAAGLYGLRRILQPSPAGANGRQRPDGNEVAIEWLGHGSFLFESCSGQRILLDPWLSTNPRCPGAYRQPNGFGKVDMILWTHGHVDHFMLDDARQLIGEYNPKIVAPWELNFFIKSEIPEADCQTFVLGNKGCTSAFGQIKITMVEAFHSAGAQLNGFEGANHFVGEAVGYILEFENGLKVYHSGDTALMGDMKTIVGDYYQPHVAILPIGGVFTMGPEEAAYACQLIGAGIVIPEHYGTFPVLTQTADTFVEAVKRSASDIEVRTVKPGERTLI